MNSQLQLNVPGLSDLLKITEALEKKDEALLWEAAKQSKSQAAFFDRLRDECSMAIYSVGSRRSQHVISHHSALFMVPVIVPPAAASIIGDQEVVRPIAHRLARWIAEWFANSTEVTVFSAANAYEEISTWSPLVMRNKLMQLSKQGPGMAYECVEMQSNLPPSAPRLAFLVAGLQRPMELPALPPLDPASDEMFKARVEGALQVISPGPGKVALQVGLPDYASAALHAGLAQWLEALNAAHPVRHWDAVPAGNDSVYLQIVTGDEEPNVSRLMLRAHQLGMDGVAKILALVAELSSRQMPGEVFRGPHALMH